MQRTWHQLACLLLFPLLVSCDDSGKTFLEADIAIYVDHGCWEESVTAANNMFQWMGYSVASVDADLINNGGLDNFRILCVPGGDMYRYSQDISSGGKENIRDFMHSGGGYIGICGGAYFASETVRWRGTLLNMTPLGLFPGSAEGPNDVIVPYPDYAMCKINITNTTHPITQSMPDSMWVLYYWGPELIVEEGADVSILGAYNSSIHTAMVALEYGEGRVFLIGTHPEIEEDSGRDGVEFGDELDDQGSDWELMRQAVNWCLVEEN